MKLLLILGLIVSLTGYGDIPEEGMRITVTDAKEDPLTGETVMELEGTLLCSSLLNVSITRSQAGLTDEFCCAGQCTAGNGEVKEELSFSPSGMAEWFAHYNPAPNSDVTVSYVFSDETESRTLTVRYANGVPAGPQQELVVHLLSGEDVHFDLKALPVTTFRQDTIVITTAEGENVYELANVRSYTYSGAAQGLNDLRASDIRIRETEGALLIDGLADKAAVEVYAIDGKLLTRMQARGMQTTVLPISGFGAGTYVINAGGISYKFTRQ